MQLALNAIKCFWKTMVFFAVLFIYTSSTYAEDIAPVSSVTSAPEYTNAPMAVAWEASDEEGGSGVASTTLWYKKEADGPWTETGETSPEASGTFTFTPADGEGSYYFATRSADNDGNEEDEPTGEGVRSVYDLTPSGPPTVTTNFGEDFSTDTPSVTLEGTTPTTVHIHVNDSEDGVTYQAGMVNWSYTGELVEGPNTFSVKAEDAAGNVSEAVSITVEYKTDMTPPVSKVTSVPEYTNAPMAVAWEASDEEGGSGVASTTLWYKKEADGPWTETGETSPEASGTFTFTPADGEGSYYFATRSADNDGNEEDEPTGEGVRSVYDLTPSGPPTVTTNFGEDFSTDTPSVTLEGTTPTTVHIHVNDSEDGVTYQAGMVNWSYTGELVEGPNTFSVKAEDAAGNVSEAVSITVEYKTDMTPPVSKVTSVPEYTNAPMAVAWEASDEEGGSGVASTALWYKKDDDGPWTDTGLTSLEDSGTFTFTPADGEGSYYFAARSIDNASNQEDGPKADGDRRSFYDLTPPGLPTVTTNSGENFSTDISPVTLNGRTPTTVHIHVNESEDGVTYQAGTVTWAYTGELVEGLNTFRIKSEDAAGNLSEETLITVEYRTDVTPPVSKVTSSVPEYTNTSMEVAWEASDGDGSGVASTALWYKKEADGAWTESGLTSPGESGTFAFTPADGEGSYYFAPRSVDNDGNEEDEPIGEGVRSVYDLTPSGPPVVTTHSGEDFSTDTPSVTLEGRTPTTVHVYVNGSKDGVTYQAGMVNWSYTGVLAEGPNAFLIKVEDAAGNVSDETSITITYDTTPPDPPVINDAYSISNAAVTLTGTCVADTGHIHVNNSPARVTYEPGQTTWSYTGPIQAGDNTFNVIALDPAGNRSGMASITIPYEEPSDDTEPPASEVTQAPAYGNGELSIFWLASDNVAIVATELWHKKETGGTWRDTGLISRGTAGTFTFTPTDGDGTYYFATRSTDKVGNVEAAPSGDGDARTIYDTAPPGQPLITTNAGEDFSTSDASVTLEGTCEMVDTDAIRVNGQGTSVTYTPGNTSWTYTGTLAEGSNIFKVTAKDAAGNISPEASIAVTYEPPPPATGGITLAWEPVTASGFKHYVLHWGTRSRNYPFNSEANADQVFINPNTAEGDISYTVTDLVKGDIYYFAVKAVYDGGESDYSNEAAIPAITLPQDDFYVDETNHAAFAISGTAAQLATVEIFANEILLGTVASSSADQGAGWSETFDFTAFEEGELELTAISTGASSEGVRGVYDKTVEDVTPPESSVVNVPEYENGAISVEWTASDDRNVASTELWYKKGDDGTWANTGLDAQTGQSGTFVYTPQDDEEGAYHFATRSTDNSGNMESEPEGVGEALTTYDTTSPPPPGITTNMGNDFTTPNPDITLDGISTADTVAVYVNNSQNGVTYQPGHTSWTYASTLQEGQNIFNVTATDAAGNVSPKSSMVVTYAPPPTDETVGITLEWDPVTDPDFDHYVLYWGESSRNYPFNSGENPDDVSVETETSYTVGGLEKGKLHYFAVKAVYTGRESDYSNEAAIPAITSPQNDFRVDGASAGAYTVSGTAAQLADVEILANTISLGNATSSSAEAGARWSKKVDFTSLEEGEIVLTTVSTGATSDTVTGTYEADQHDVTPPVSDASAPESANTDSVSVSWNASDDLSGVASTELWHKKENDGTWTATGLSEAGTRGTFVYTPPDGDGNYYFAARATDNAGNAEDEPSGDGHAHTYYDTTAPGIPVIEGASLDGPSIVFTGTLTEDTVALRVYVNGVEDGVIYPEDKTTWRYSPTTLQPGVNTIEIVAEDAAGNESAKVSVEIAYQDILPPASEVTAAPEYATGEFSLEWTAEDSGSGVALTELWYKKGADGTWAKAGLDAMPGESGTFLHTPQDGDGTYHFATQATDNADNQEAEPEGDGDAPVIFDTTPPEPPVITTNRGEDFLSDGYSLTLEGTCAEDTVRMVVNGSTKRVSHTVGDTSWRYTGTLTTGENLFNVTATDAAGNESAEDSITVTYNPLVEDDTVASISKVVSVIHEDEGLLIEWEASDDISGVGAVDLWYKAGDDGVWMNTGLPGQTGTDGVFIYTPDNDGTYYFATRSTDNAGNQEAESEGDGDADVVFDATPPDPPIITTNSGDDYSAEMYRVTLEGTCSEDTDAIEVNGSTNGVTHTPGETSWTYTGTLTAGENSFVIIAKDEAENLGDEVTIVVTYEPPTDDITRPNSEVTDVPESGNGELPIQWTASDDLSGVAATQLWYKKGLYGTWTDTGLSETGESGIFLYTPKDGDGTYHFATRATDNAGNVEIQLTSEGDAHTIFDTTPSDPPVISEGYDIVNAVVTLSGTCTTDTVAIYVNGSADGVTYTPADASWSYTGHLQVAQNTLDVTASDAPGNMSGKASIVVTYEDTVRPGSRLAVEDVPLHTNAAIPLSWSAWDDESGVASTQLWYKERVDGTWADTGLDPQEGESGTFLHTPSQDGEYCFATRSVDHVGNWEPEPEGDGNVCVTYDTTPPDAPVITTNEGADVEADAYHLALAGTCSGDDTAVIHVNDSNNGVTHTAGETSWTYSGTLVSGENNLFSVTAKDAAGNVSPETSIRVTYTPLADGEAPGSEVTDIQVDGERLLILWNAWDNTAGPYATELWHKKGSDGSWASTDLAQRGITGTYAYTPEDGDGAYYFATRAFDNAGNAEAAPSGDGDARIIYDTTPPDPPVITTNSGEDFSLEEYMLTLEGTCPADTEAIEVNGSNSGVTYTAGDTTWSYTGGLLAGANRFDVTATDAGGKESSPDTITVTYESPTGDTEPPTSEVTDAPDYGNAVLSLSWIASDDLSGLASTQLWYKKGTYGAWKDTGLSERGTAGVFFYRPTNGEGTYGFATRSEDNAGNWEAQPSGEGDARTFYDLTRPASPVINEEYSLDEQYLLTLTGTCPSDAVAIYVNDSVEGVTYTPGGTSWTYTSPSAAKLYADNRFTATAADAAGNRSMESSRLIHPEPLDATAPVSTITVAPAYANGEFPIEWTATDDASGVAATELWFKKGVDGVWTDTGLSQTGTAGVYLYLPELGDGAYYFATQSQDNVGNEEDRPSGDGDASTTFDTTPPNPPVIRTQLGLDFSTEISFAELDGTVRGDVVAVHVNGSAEGVLLNKFFWSYSSTLNEGINTFTITAADAAGNWSEGSSIRVTYGGPVKEAVIIEWEPVTDPGLSHYVLYWGTTSGDYPFDSVEDREDVIEQGPTSYAITTLDADQPLYFIVKAVYENGDEAYLDEMAIPSISSPEDDFHFDEPDADYTISGTAAENASVGIFVNGTLMGIATSTAAAEGATWSKTIDFSGLRQGPVTLVAKSTGFSSDAVQGSYGDVVYDRIPPESDAVSAAHTHEDELLIGWNASDNASGVARTELWYKKGLHGKWADTGFSQAGTSGTFIFDLYEGEGAYYFATRSIDTDGNAEASPSGIGDTRTVYDATPTDPPVITTAGGADHVTEEGSVTLTGTCPGDTQAIYVNGSTDGVVHLPGYTSWTYTGELQPGGNAFEIVTEDAAGNRSAASSIGVYYQSDTVAPVSDASAPAIANGPISVDWTASDDDFGVAETALWYKKDADRVWAEAAIPSQPGTEGTFVFTPEYGDGVYHFATRSFDHAGNEEAEPTDEGETHTIFDTEPPEPPLITTNDGADYATPDTSVTLKGTCATDAAAIKVNDSVEGVTHIPGEETWHYAATLQAEETTFRVTAQDAAGNRSSETSIRITYEPDALPPSSTADAPAFANQDISVAWTASDDDSGVAQTRLWYKKDADGTWADTGIAPQSGTEGTYIFTPSDGDGTYYFATRSVDTAGNEEAKPTGAGDTRTFYDTEPPPSPVIMTNSGADYSTFERRLALEGTCSEDALTIEVNGSAEDVAHTPGGVFWSYAGALQEGANRFEIAATDAAGNSSPEAFITVSHTSDTMPPDSQASAPTYANDALSIAWEASDAGSGVAVTSLWYKTDEGTWADTGLPGQSGDAGVFAYTPTEEGIYYMATRSMDHAGNVETAPTGEGDARTIYDITPPDSTAYAPASVSGAFPIEWTASDNVSGMADVELWFKSGEDGTWAHTGMSAPSSTSGRFLYTPDQEGAYYFATVSQDIAGNAELQPDRDGDVRVVYVTTPLTPPAVTGHEIEGSDIILSGTCGSDAVAIYVNGSDDGVTHTLGETSWSYTERLKPGENRFQITATDVTGHTSETSFVVTFGYPTGGYVTANVIPAEQVSQSGNGDGIITISFKIEDPSESLCLLHTFEYSADGGATWDAPADGNGSVALGIGWRDNNGESYRSGLTFAEAPVHAFTLNTRHPDVIGLDGTDQEDVRIRLSITNGIFDSLAPVVSEPFRVDNLAPSVAIAYDVPGPYSEGDAVMMTAEFDEAGTLSGVPQITIDYAGEGIDVTAEEMTETDGRTVWGYTAVIPPNAGGTAIVTITGMADEAGNPVGDHAGHTFVVDDGAEPVIKAYTIDAENRTIDITYSEPGMQHATDPAAYRFTPSLTVNEITDLGGGTYRLSFDALPAHTILTLTPENVMDAAGNPVSPTPIVMNDDDSDEMPDDWEDEMGVDDPDEDADQDGLDNLAEFESRTDPHDPDTDGDTLPDGWELDRELDPTDSTGINGTDGDLDGDGLDNLAEFESGTDPHLADTDGDTLPDGWELDYGLDPTDSAGVNGADGDLDGDGLDNAEEFESGTDPQDSDTDGDTLPDGWELDYGLDPTDGTGINGTDGDLDGDGWSNGEEHEGGYDPDDDTSHPKTDTGGGGGGGSCFLSAASAAWDDVRPIALMLGLVAMLAGIGYAVRRFLS